MHVDHELVEVVPVDEQEYDEVIEEYEEEILMQEWKCICPLCGFWCIDDIQIRD